MILIGTDDGIYRWFEGAGWPIFHSLQGRSIVGLAAPGAGMLVALDRAGSVFESVDNGQEWRTIPAPEGAGTTTSLAVLGTPPLILLATRPGGLYRRALGAPVPRAGRTAAAGPGRASAVLGRARTLAEGATALLATRPMGARVDPKTAAQAGWTRLSSAPGGFKSQKAEIRAVALGEGSPAAWYASVRGSGLWRSLDAGSSWSPSAGLPAEVEAVRAVPGRPGHVFAATSDGCWFSGDGGQTWEDRSTGLESSRSLTALDVKPGAPDVLLAGARVGRSEAAGAGSPPLASSLFESNNGGKTWTLVRRGNPDILANDAIADIRHDPAAPDNAVMALASGELWVTRNGGAYWMPLARQIRAARVLAAVG